MVGFAALASNGNFFTGCFGSDGLRHTRNDLFQSETETASKGVANQIYRVRHVSVYKNSASTFCMSVFLPKQEQKVRTAHFGGLII